MSVTPEQQEIADEFEVWLANNYTNNVVLDDFVKMMGCSRSTVQRALAATGMSWRDELISARIKEGARLLKANRALTVGQIAGMVGYSQSAQFSRVFRERMGKTPLEHRNGGDN